MITDIKIISENVVESDFNLNQNLEKTVLRKILMAIISVTTTQLE